MSGNWEVISRPDRLYSWISEQCAESLLVERLEYTYDDDINNIIDISSDKLMALCRSRYSFPQCFLLLFRVCEKPVSRIEYYKGIWGSPFEHCKKRFDKVGTITEVLELQNSVVFLSAVPFFDIDFHDIFCAMYEFPFDTRIILLPNDRRLQIKSDFVHSILKVEVSGGNDFVFFDNEAICRYVSLEKISVVQISDCGDEGDVIFYSNRTVHSCGAINLPDGRSD